MHRDAAVLRMAASVIDRRVEGARHLGIKRLAEELITSLERELDYCVEAASAGSFLEHLDRMQGSPRRSCTRRSRPGACS